MLSPPIDILLYVNYNIPMTPQALSWKTRRLRLGLSQRALARRARVAFRTIQLLEAGGRDHRASTLDKVAKVLGTPIAMVPPSGKALASGPTAAETAARMRDGGPDSWKLHLFELVDAFRRDPRPFRVARAPEPDTPPRALALTASTVEALCAERGLKAPWWCGGVPALPDPWFPSEMESLKAEALAQSPAAFRRRGIFVLGNFLSRA